jgi:2-methylcitrate dehydratase PrpD
MINASAVGLAGAAQSEALALTRFVQDMGGGGICTIFGMGLRTSPVYACLANGLMVRLLDFDDEILGRGSHPTSLIFPVVMAMAEFNGCSGKQALNAFALGCEITSKLGAMLAPQRTSGPLVPHPDEIAGVIGAAAAGGWLLGLDQAQMETALAIAGSHTPVDWANNAGPTTALDYGQAAMKGVMAALLAQRGMTVPGGMYSPKWLTGNLPKDEQDPFFASLGNPHDVIDPGVALRLYPCALEAHSAIDAAMELLQQHRIAPGEAASAAVSVSPEARRALPFDDPQDPWQARHSLNYLVAAALLRGQPLIEQFSPAALADPAVHRLMRRITVAGDQPATALSPQPASITVTGARGLEVRQRVEFARGGPDLPLDPQDLDAKFLYCARHVMTPDHIQGAIEQFRDLENIPHVTGLASILGA